MYQKLTLIGRTGQDPEVRYGADGSAFANVSLATTEKWTTKTGEKKELTQWHRLIFFDKKAEVVRDYVKKGDLLHIEGKVKYRSYDNKDGVKVYVTEIQVQNLLMLGGKKDASTNQGSEVKQAEPTVDEHVAEVYEENDIPF